MTNKTKSVTHSTITPSNTSISTTSNSYTAGVPLLRDRWKRLRVIHPVFKTDPDFETQQQFKDECDMNKIVANARRGIEPSYINPAAPRFGDFSDIPDLTAAYNQIKDAEEAFASLPSELRLELGNDPRRIDELTHEQARRFNLLKELPEPTSPASPKEPKATTPPKAGQAAKPGTEPGSSE